MPRITEEKKESIWKTYSQTKGYTVTAKKENVDERTVSSVVKNKKAHLEPPSEHIGFDKKGPTPTQSRKGTISPELKIQLKANERFEQGDSNLKVSQDLKLPPSIALKYRNEYNDMKKADLDRDLEEKKQHLARLNEITEPRRIELEELKEQLNTVNSTISTRQTKASELQEEIDAQTQELEELGKTFQQMSNESLMLTRVIESRKQESQDLKAEKEKLKNKMAAFIKKMQTFLESDEEPEVDRTS